MTKRHICTIHLESSEAFTHLPMRVQVGAHAYRQNSLKRTNATTTIETSLTQAAKRGSDPAIGGRLFGVAECSGHLGVSS
jgi:hypothetical protein